MSSRRWTNITKSIAAATLAILAIFLLVTFRAMIPPTIVAFLIAFILSYPVNWIQSRTGWTRGTVVVCFYLLFLGTLAAGPALAIPWMMGLADSLRETLEELVQALQTSSGTTFGWGVFQISADTLFAEAGNILQNVLGLANPLSIARGVTTGVLTVVYVLVLNFWILKDLHKLRRAIFEQIPADYQEDMLQITQELGDVWDGFLRGQVVLGIVIGIITWIALSVVGMPNAGGLALLAGFMEFLPTIGPGISGTIGTAVALFQVPTTWLPFDNPLIFALLIAGIYAVITQVESVYLIPRLVGGRVQLHPAVTFVGIINGAIVFGVLGVLLATPVIASARIILSYVYRKLMDIEPFENVHIAQSAVRIRGLIAGRKIEAVLFDLDGTLTAIDWQFSERVVHRFSWLQRFIPLERRQMFMRRLMIAFEGLINFTISQSRRFQFHQNSERLAHILDGLRGYPRPEQIELLPDVADTLGKLGGRYRLALFSTRERADLEQGLLAAGLDKNMFETIVAGEDVRNLVPHSEPLVAAANRLDLQTNNVLVVSDTDTNLRSAGAAEMATAGVLQGLGTAKDLRNADLVLNNIVELSEWL